MKRALSLVLLALTLASAWVAAQISVSGTTSGPVVSLSSLVVGSNGTRIVQIRSVGGFTFDSANIAATTKVVTQITVEGAAAGDLVLFCPRSAFEDDIILSEVTVGTDTVAVALYNPTAGAINPAAVVADLIWFDLTP